jgi:hypothetical protein
MGFINCNGVMLNYRQYGHEDMKNYIDCYLLRAKDMAAKQPARKRRNLKTFTAPKVVLSGYSSFLHH